MNILITGGAGFIGSHLCKLLVERGDRVICVDNLITGFKKNIENLTHKDNFKFIEHDVSKSLYIKEEIDWVYHLASLASPKHYLNYPIKTLKSGLLGTHNCLGIAKNKKAKFLLASTSEVYGDPLVHPQPESYWGNVSSTGLRSCYDESKRAAESLTYAYMRKHLVDVRVARIFNTYGPNMHPDDGRVVSNFITQSLKEKDITIYGEGTQTRSFCYVQDLIEGLIKLTEVDYKAPLNLGNPREFTIKQLADMVLAETKSNSQIKKLPLPEDDPKRRKPDISKAKQLLNWQSTVPLEQGLQKTIDYFKSVLSIES
ncbi:MAG: SDR family oxidoreductase [Candidatus Omnitrophica bacterium]|nr:SDR family oxidoreductase [Candidatus Omnitrophota bacterium]